MTTKKPVKKRVPQHKTANVKSIVIDGVKDEDEVVIVGDNTYNCEECKGTGLKSREELCPICHGNGRID